jgi:30S ribosomal protein S31
MGKHDKRTRRGKITRGTFGKSRPRKATKAATPAKKKAPAKKKYRAPLTVERIERCAHVSCSSPPPLSPFLTKSALFPWRVG